MFHGPPLSWSQILQLSLVKDPGAQRERLVREVVRVDETGYDEACKIADKIQQEAGTGAAVWAFPYRVMIVSACASLALRASLLPVRTPHHDRE